MPAMQMHEGQNNALTGGISTAICPLLEGVAWLNILLGYTHDLSSDLIRCRQVPSDGGKVPQGACDQI